MIITPEGWTVNGRRQRVDVTKLQEEVDLAKKRAQSTSTPSTERTSNSFATVAGQLLNGFQTNQAVTWVAALADAPDTPPAVREHAVALLGVIGSLRRIAASALTQR